VQEQVQAVTKFIDIIIEFGVKYGFQFLGALVFFIIGIKLAGWCATRIKGLLERKELDPMLVKFIGGVIKLLVVAIIIIITLGNFGISIAPLVALAGGAVFGATYSYSRPPKLFKAPYQTMAPALLSFLPAPLPLATPSKLRMLAA
jgi:small conductance mechanosensitive channel